MKFASLAFGVAVALYLLGCAQQYKKPLCDDSTHSVIKNDLRETNPAGLAVPAGSTDETSPRRLESFTWDSVKHQLTWRVSKGEKAGDSYKPLSTDQYHIDMDNATMTVSGETRRFSKEEADNVQTLMGLISEYAVESTVWWEKGEGEPVDGRGSRTPLAPRNPKNLIPTNPNVASNRSFAGLAALRREGRPVAADSMPIQDRITNSLLALSVVERPLR
jgi:hypothetical protein